jgi:DNA polymerase delta subunit 1
VGRKMIDHTKELVEKWYDCKVVYGDTDSVMAEFYTSGSKDPIAEAMKQALEAAIRISETFKPPIKLEFEKVYHPYFLFKKKRYAGIMYTEKFGSSKPAKMDVKGIEVVRRDGCSLMRNTQQSILDALLKDRDEEKAKRIAVTTIQNLLNHKIPLDDLIISKGLSKKEYASANLPHVCVAAKMEQRTPGFGPKTGDRVQYVVSDVGNPKIPQYERAEDPVYFKENNMKIDVEYYVEHQLRNPVTLLLGALFPNPDAVFDHTISSFKLKKAGVRTLDNFVTGKRKSVDEILMDGIDKAASRAIVKKTKKTKPVVRQLTLFKK